MLRPAEIKQGRRIFKFAAQIQTRSDLAAPIQPTTKCKGRLQSQSPNSVATNVESPPPQKQSPLRTSRGSRETMIEKQKVNNKESVTPGRRIKEPRWKRKVNNNKEPIKKP